MTGTTKGPLEWRKSSYSGGNGECVEFAVPHPATVAVRDSKDPDGALLHFTDAAWTAFVHDVAAGAFDAAAV